MFFGLPRQDAVKVRNEKTGIRLAGLVNVVLYDFSIDAPEVFNVAFAGGRGAILDGAYSTRPCPSSGMTGR